MSFQLASLNKDSKDTNYILLGLRLRDNALLELVLRKSFPCITQSYSYRCKGPGYRKWENAQTPCMRCMKLKDP